jgi:hypothetical protein
MKKKEDDPDSLLSPTLVERRTAIAKMRSLELGVEKEYINLEERKKNICRIDAALSAFDEFLTDFVEMLRSLPDFVQSTIPATTPTQYSAIEAHIDQQLQRLSQKRLYLAIDSTCEEKARATAQKNESIKNTKSKKKKG